MTKFENWIVTRGRKKIASILDVDTTAISHWAAGRAFPRVHHLALIEVATEGEIDANAMLAHWRKKQTKRRRTN